MPPPKFLCHPLLCHPLILNCLCHPFLATLNICVLKKISKFRGADRHLKHNGTVRTIFAVRIQNQDSDRRVVKIMPFLFFYSKFSILKINFQKLTKCSDRGNFLEKKNLRILAPKKIINWRFWKSWRHGPDRAVVLHISCWFLLVCVLSQLVQNPKTISSKNFYCESHCLSIFLSSHPSNISSG